MLRMLRVPVHDSDVAVHRALMPGGKAFEEVALTFREAWDARRHVIDRKKLGAIVFNDRERLAALEDILHPIARESQMEFVRAMKRMGRKAVALEIPLLFETGAEERVDYVICVSAPPAIQRRRVMKRPGMTEEKFAAILASQMPDKDKRALSDFIVETGRGYAHTYGSLRRILKETGVR